MLAEEDQQEQRQQVRKNADEIVVGGWHPKPLYQSLSATAGKSEYEAVAKRGQYRPVAEYQRGYGKIPASQIDARREIRGNGICVTHTRYRRKPAGDHHGYGSDAVYVNASRIRRVGIVTACAKMHSQEAAYIVHRISGSTRQEEAVEQILDMFTRTKSNREFCVMMKRLRLV